VRSTTYLGALSRHRLAGGSEELLMETHAAPAVGGGPADEVEIALDPARLRLLR
jgi:hypothetical protein